MNMNTKWIEEQCEEVKSVAELKLKIAKFVTEKSSEFRRMYAEFNKEEETYLIYDANYEFDDEEGCLVLESASQYVCIKCNEKICSDEVFELLDYKHGIYIDFI